MFYALVSPQDAGFPLIFPTLSALDHYFHFWGLGTILQFWAAITQKLVSGKLTFMKLGYYKRCKIKIHPVYINYASFKCSFLFSNMKHFTQAQKPRRVRTLKATKLLPPQVEFHVLSTDPWRLASKERSQQNLTLKQQKQDNNFNKQNKPNYGSYSREKLRRRLLSVPLNATFRHVAQVSKISFLQLVNQHNRKAEFKDWPLISQITMNQYCAC